MNFISKIFGFFSKSSNTDEARIKAHNQSTSATRTNEPPPLLLIIGVDAGSSIASAVSASMLPNKQNISQIEVLSGEIRRPDVLTALHKLAVGSRSGDRIVVMYTGPDTSESPTTASDGDSTIGISYEELKSCIDTLTKYKGIEIKLFFNGSGPDMHEYDDTQMVANRDSNFNAFTIDGRAAQDSTADESAATASELIQGLGSDSALGELVRALAESGCAKVTTYDVSEDLIEYPEEDIFTFVNDEKESVPTPPVSRSKLTLRVDPTPNVRRAPAPPDAQKSLSWKFLDWVDALTDGLTQIPEVDEHDALKRADDDIDDHSSTATLSAGIAAGDNDSAITRTSSCDTVVGSVEQPCVAKENGLHDLATARHDLVLDDIELEKAVISTLQRTGVLQSGSDPTKLDEAALESLVINMAHKTSDKAEVCDIDEPLRVPGGQDVSKETLKCGLCNSYCALLDIVTVIGICMLPRYVEELVVPMLFALCNSY